MARRLTGLGHSFSRGRHRQAYRRRELADQDRTHALIQAQVSSRSLARTT